MAASETERREQAHNAALANLTTQPSAAHPIVAPKPAGETDRVNQIILSNLAVRND